MTRQPLMLVCEGAGQEWRARVIKVGTRMGGWKLPDPRDRREAEAKTAREAVQHAITLYGKEPRTCRRCGRTWECRRTRAIRICPACQTKRAAQEVAKGFAVRNADLVPLIVNRGKP